MKPEDLRQTMKEVGLTSSDVGLICGCTDRQVRHWLSGVHAIPRSVWIVLQGMRENAINREWVTDMVMHDLRRQMAELEGSQE